jgi:predicted glutamine amidotransferase
MCIVILKPKGVKITDELFRAFVRSGNSNSDGIGVSIKRKGAKGLSICKGLYKAEPFIKALKEIELYDDDEILFHARIRTHGDISNENCHPYIVTTDEGVRDLLNEDNVHYPVLAHNGFFSEFHDGSKHSDTYCYVQSYATMPEVMSLMEIAGNIENPDTKLQKMVLWEHIKSVDMIWKLARIYLSIQTEALL